MSTRKMKKWVVYLMIFIMLISTLMMGLAMFV